MVVRKGLNKARWFPVVFIGLGLAGWTATPAIPSAEGGMRSSGVGEAALPQQDVPGAKEGPRARPGGSIARLSAGGGMEYYTVKAAVDEADGRYFHSLLQTTLAVIQIGYEYKPWRLTVLAGLSDWNVSGEWQGTELSAVSSEPFYWARQQKLEVEADYSFWGPLALGIRISDHALVHYNGMTQERYLQYRMQSASAWAHWEFLRIQDLGARISAGWAPQVYTTFYQRIYFSSIDYELVNDELTDVARQWLACLKVEYRDSAGWGLDVAYAFSWLTLDQAGEKPGLRIKTGHLLGCFLLTF
ncbi:hypothetical protein JW933_01195 [candidate division FCPU426 bacterium]|nr:hypothetical protein [candidate division FCPU426 bacterium]